MRVFFDYSIFTLQRFGGVSNYIVNLVNNFSEDIDPVIISPIYRNDCLKKTNKAKKFIYLKKTGPFNKIINKINKAYFNYKINLEMPKIIHYTYFNEKNFYNSKIKQIVTEYDLIKEKFYSEKFKSQISYKKELYEKIDHIICISDNTKKDLLDNYKIDESKVSVIKLAFNDSKKIRQRSINIKPFILFVGNRERYKNFNNTIRAYALSQKIKSDFDFVCFGGKRFSFDERKLFKDIGIETKIHLFDGDELDLNFLYSKARLFIFPSLYEGFGLPLLEAMNMDCPVICSNTSCFPEIVNNAAIFFDPKDIDSIKSQMEKTIFDNELLLDLKNKGVQNLNKYSWEKCSNETEKVYEKII